MKKNNNIFFYFINSLIILSIFLISFKINDIYPFGNYDFAKYDAIYQYKPFLYSFISSIKNGTLYSYSFLNGLGGPTVFNYVYYLSSPANYVALLFKTPDQMFFSVTVFKILIGSIISFFYFYKKSNNNVISIICSVSYTYSAWLLANYFNIMWLDAFFMFPLFHYGLEKLINENKIVVYILSLSYIMISNFYMAFIVCLYTLVYYLFNIIFVKKDKYKNKIRNFDLIFIATIIVFLICFFYIFDVYSSLLKIGIYVSNISNDFSSINVLYLIKSIFSGVNYISMTPVRESIINVSSSLVITISYFYYFINKNISVKDRIIHLVVTLFIIVLVCSKSLNYIANGFHIPVGYHYRYSFIISFYALRIFCKNFKNWNNILIKRIYYVNIVLLILLLILLFTNSIEFNIFIFNVVILGSITLWLLFYNSNKYHRLLLLTLLIFEVLFSLSNSISVSKKDINSNNYYGKEYYRNDSSGAIKYELNNNLYSNSSEITSFSSMQYLDTIDLLGFMGCSNDEKASIAICDNSSFFNMIFNVYNEKYNLNKVYAVDDRILSFNGWKKDFVYNQNYLSYLMSGIDNQFEIANNEYTLVNSNNNVYHYEINKFNNNMYFLVYDNNVSMVIFDDYRFYLSLYSSYGVKIKNNVFDIATYDGNEPKIKVYKENLDTLKKIYDYLSEGEIKYTAYQDDLIEGKIYVNNNQIIFTSIPYDDDWDAFIDGNSVETIEVLDSLLAIPCDEGYHTIKLQYKRNNIIPITISIVSFISLIIIIIFFIVRRKKCKGNV